MIHELDPRLYGIAPREAEAHDGRVFWTKEALLRQLGITETTLRLTPELMALRRQISPRKYLWVPDEVRAYVANLPTPTAPVAVTQALAEVRKTTKKRRTLLQTHREMNAKLGWEPPKLPQSRRRKGR